MIDLQQFLAPYNPWHTEGIAAFAKLSTFLRLAFDPILNDLKSLPQVISITGPRRIGKSTIVRQIVRKLMEEGIPPSHLIYYSFDDPSLQLPENLDTEFFPILMEHAKALAADGQPVYLFLDEIQRGNLWELYVKKYYDLGYPVRMVISGSASSPIFKNSRESLMGRVKEYHLLSFSFKEYALFQSQFHTDDEGRLHRRIMDICGSNPDGSLGLFDLLESRADKFTLRLPISEWIQENLDRLLGQYLMQGGFPEVWAMDSWVQKYDYLIENQINKVIFEDLVLAAEFRKPEQLKRFYLSLLADPGVECNATAISSKIEVSVALIEKYLPLLEMTDLVFHVSNFRNSPTSARRGNMKFYLSDLVLRNAVLRLSDTLIEDTATLGYYAENLVFLRLHQWKGKLGVGYFRNRSREIDFIVHIGAKTLLPIEVKYQNSIDERDGEEVLRFHAEHSLKHPGIIITKRWEHFGPLGDGMPVFQIPLPLFLLLFDT